MYIVYSIGFLSHLTDLYHKVPVYDIVQWNFSLSPFFIFYFFLNTNKEVGVRGTRWQSENINFVVISNKLPRACRQYLDRSFLISFTRGKKKKKERRKGIRLFTSSFPHRLRFIGHPLSTSHSRYSNAFSPLFFHEVASLSGYRINPSSVETGSWRSSSPPWCNTGYPIEHRSSFSLFLVISSTPRSAMFQFWMCSKIFLSNYGRRFVHYFLKGNLLSQLTSIWTDRSFARFKFSFHTPIYLKLIEISSLISIHSVFQNYFVKFNRSTKCKEIIKKCHASSWMDILASLLFVCHRCFPPRRDRRPRKHGYGSPRNFQFS